MSKRLTDLLHAFEPVTERFQVAEIILVKIDFARAGVPTVNEHHVAGFDPPGGTVGKDFVSACGTPVARFVRLEIPETAKVIRILSRVVPHQAVTHVESAHEVRREHPCGLGTGQFDGAPGRHSSQPDIVVPRGNPAEIPVADAPLIPEARQRPQFLLDRDVTDGAPNPVRLLMASIDIGLSFGRNVRQCSRRRSGA